MLIKLNRILRAWAYAYRKVVAKARMQYIDYQIHALVKKWLEREHRSKTWGKIKKRYFQWSQGRYNFGCAYRGGKGVMKVVQLFRTAELPIRYPIKIRGKAKPYDLAYKDYFKRRQESFKRDALKDRVRLRSSYLERVATC